MRVNQPMSCGIVPYSSKVEYNTVCAKEKEAAEVLLLLALVIGRLVNGHWSLMHIPRDSSRLLEHMDIEYEYVLMVTLAHRPQIDSTGTLLSKSVRIVCTRKVKGKRQKVTE